MDQAQAIVNLISAVATLIEQVDDLLLTDAFSGDPELTLVGQQLEKAREILIKKDDRNIDESGD